MRLERNLRNSNYPKSVPSDFQDSHVQNADLPNPKHILLNQKKSMEAFFYRDNKWQGSKGRESRNAPAGFGQENVLKCYLDIQPNSFVVTKYLKNKNTPPTSNSVHETKTENYSQKIYTTDFKIHLFLH